MADNEKKARKNVEGAGDGKADRRRLSYLKIRSRELKKEQQALKAESETLRAKLGQGDHPKKKKKADDADED